MGKPVHKVALALPEVKDLPPDYVFRGWFSSPTHQGWYAFVNWEKKNCPPMGQQITVTIDELVGLSDRARKALTKEKIDRVIFETDSSLKALGWDRWPDTGPFNPGVGLAGVLPDYA